MAPASPNKSKRRIIGGAAPTLFWSSSGRYSWGLRTTNKLICINWKMGLGNRRHLITYFGLGKLRSLLSHVSGGSPKSGSSFRFTAVHPCLDCFHYELLSWQKFFLTKSKASRTRNFFFQEWEEKALENPENITPKVDNTRVSKSKFEDAMLLRDASRKWCCLKC
jgi:hypothetical protein